jgi:DNA ligase 1
MNCILGNKGNILYKGKLLLAKEYLKKTGEPTINPVGWWASEKYDGYRALWNGKDFRSRNGNKFNVPEWFTQIMPPDYALDGEFWVGRGCFDKCGIFKKKLPETDEWIDKKVIYKVFDVPSYNKPFKERMKKLKDIVKNRCKCKKTFKLPKKVSSMKCPIEVTQQTKIKSKEHLNNMFSNVIKGGGEGIMLRKPQSIYEGKRSSTLLKMKVEFDTEAEIIGYKLGVGKYIGMLGSFKCKLILGKNKGVTFNVSGMNDEIRTNYKKTHKIGTIITIAFNDYTKDGVPRHPRYLRKKDDYKL